MHPCPYCGMALQPSSRTCPYCKREIPTKEAPGDTHEGTRLESVDEIREVLSRKAGSTAKEPSTVPEAVSFRPVRRPPMALLCILDDGRQEGEWVRIRGNEVSIGRAEGDIIIPHDDVMSSRHAKLVREVEQGHYRWHLVDLQSTNGTYVRIGKANLRPGQEMLLGSRRYRFEVPAQAVGSAAEETGGDADKPKGTHAWQSVSQTEMFPSFVEITAQGDGQRFLLDKSEFSVGRDPKQCQIVLTSDPMVSARHARLFRDSRGRWQVENAESLNGTWLRIQKIALNGSSQFQLGEQRFLVRIP